MSRYYPICLDKAGLPCLIVGGGAVGLRKVRTLLAHRGKITVVAKALGDSVSYRVQTDDKGRFAINCMNPAKYVLEAFLDHDGNQRKDVADTFYVELGDTLDIAPCAKPRYVEMRLKRED